jgi:hypothetical protein
MTIHPRPDQEIAIQEAIKAGLVRTEIDVLDIGLDNLRAILIDRMQSNKSATSNKKNNLVDIFSSVRGDDLNFSRNQSTGRTIEL